MEGFETLIFDGVGEVEVVEVVKEGVRAGELGKDLTVVVQTGSEFERRRRQTNSCGR